MSAPATLHLMRHGAPETPGLMLGHTDMPVSGQGIADCVSKAAGLELRAIISSDLGRAAACAEAIANHRGLTVQHDPRWRELDFGAWDGCAVGAIDQAALAAFWADPDAAPPPQGEGWSALRARVGEALAGVADGALIVSHAGAIRAALSVLCGFDHRQCWAIDLPYAALISLRLWHAPTLTAQITALRP